MLPTCEDVHLGHKGKVIACDSARIVWCDLAIAHALDAAILSGSLPKLGCQPKATIGVPLPQAVSHSTISQAFSMEL